jgi:hypothetical protein
MVRRHESLSERPMSPFQRFAIWFLMRVPLGRFGERYLMKWTLGASKVREEKR